MESRFLRIVRIVCFFSTLLLVTQLSIYINNVQRIAFNLAIFTYLLEFFLEKKWKFFRWENTPKQWFFVTIIFYYLLQFIFLPFEKNTSQFGVILEERLPFLALGVVGIFGLNRYFRLKYFAWTFVVVSLILGIFLLSHLNQQIISSPIRNLLLGEIRIQYLNCHMNFNYYLNASLIFIYYLFGLEENKKSSWIKTILIFSLIVIVINLFLSEGRIGMLSGMLVLGILILQYLWKFNKLITIVGFFVFALFSIFTIEHTSKFSHQSIEQEPRQIIWKLAIQEVERTKFIGEGASTSAYNLNEVLMKHGLLDKHPHNAFIQSVIDYGLLGFSVLLSFFVLGYFSVSKNLRLIMALVLLITFAQLMVGVFIRDLHPLLFLLVVILIIHQDTQDTLQEKKVLVLD